MNFTPRCSRAIDNAKASLAEFNHSHVSSAHLLLGLLQLGDGVPMAVLRKFRVSVELVKGYLSARRSSLEDAPSKENSLIGKSAEVAFKRAEAAAAKFGHTYVGTDHLLLAIALEEAGDAADLFASLHADKAAIGKEVFREIAPPHLWREKPNP